MNRSSVFAPVLWLTAFLGLFSSSLPAAESGQFTFEIGREGDTIGELKPPFIKLESDAEPKVSVREVMRRYRVLFNKSDDPKIRVEALWRLSELEAEHGAVREMSVKEEAAFYQRALESYLALLNENNPDYPNDALLYQSAKAYDILGKQAESVEMLVRLAKQYPRSRYATESWFRIAESYFSNGQYQKAEAAYQRVMQARNEAKFYDKAVFMLGWSKYKQGRPDDSLIHFLEILDIAYNKDKSLKGLDKGLQATVDDTLRIMSIVFANSPQPDPVAALMASSGERVYVDQLYRSLSEFYFRKQNYQDAVRVNKNFLRAYPDHAAAPAVAYRNIEILEAADFVTDVWAEKRHFIDQYGRRFDILQNAPDHLKEEYKSRVMKVLDDLAHFDFVRAGKTKDPAVKSAAYAAAARYYATYAELFPEDSKSGNKLFMAGEASFLNQQYDEAVRYYRKSAYETAKHAKSAEAGYSALVAFRKAHEAALEGPGNEPVKLAYIDLTRLFSQTFPEDRRARAVTLETLKQLVDLERYEDIDSLTTAVLASHAFKNDWKATKQLLLAQAKARFNLARYPESRETFLALLHMRHLTGKERRDTEEQLGIATYKIGEAHVMAGRWEDAVATWIDLGKKFPHVSVAKNARFDAATELLKHERWKEAIPVLVEFRQDYPNDELTTTIPEKLIACYLETGQKLYAADELEQLHEQVSDPEKKRVALLQAAALYREAGKDDLAAKLYTRYEKAYPVPYEDVLEARYRLVEYYRAKGQSAKMRYWQQRLVDGHFDQGDASDRSLALAAEALLALAEDKKSRYDALRLKLPLKKSLKAKKAALKEVVDYYNRLAKLGLKNYSSVVTWSLADVYYGLARSIMESDRPGNLDDLQKEQYEILLEEQAFPFEEKAISLHKMNIRNTLKGIYDKWVQESYRFLSRIEPARYQRETLRIGSSRELY